PRFGAFTTRFDSVTCAGGGREDRRAFSGHQFPDHIAVHVGKTEVAAGMPEGELLVVKTEQCQNGGVEVVNMYFVLDGLETKFVGRAVDTAAAHAAARQPHREAVVVVVASRSEEHTSELQSRGHLVCRLLLEKKKPIPHTDFPLTHHQLRHDNSAAVG